VKSVKKLVYAWVSQKYMAGCSNYNSLSVRRSCRSKAQARAVFASNNVPHARGLVFLNPWQAHKFAREHGFPLVIKPNVSGYSRGSHFPINNFRELWKAALWAKAWWPTSVVEQYLLGSNYRVLATADTLVSVIQRYPPFVEGNGTDPISALIDKENSTRAKMNLHPVIYPIHKSTDVIAYLQKQGLTLNSVPAAGARTYLFNRVALAPGGVVEIIDQKIITPKNRELCQHIVTMFGANLLGIDVIFETGIDVDYDQQRCIFLEVNSRPYIKMHEYPRYGKREDLSGFFAEMDRLAIADPDTF